MGVAVCACMYRRTINVSFMARRNGGGDVLVYLLHVHVRPQPVVVDQVLVRARAWRACWARAEEGGGWLGCALAVH